MKEVLSRWRRPRDERGAASMLQLVIVTPVLLFGVFMVIQVGLMLNARDVAQQAAQEGASAARRFDGSEAAGVNHANQFLSQTGTSTLLAANVTASRNAHTARVTVTGTVITFLPGLHLHVSEQATGPVERYVPPVNDQP